MEEELTEELVCRVMQQISAGADVADTALVRDCVRAGLTSQVKSVKTLKALVLERTWTDSKMQSVLDEVRKKFPRLHPDTASILRSCLDSCIDALETFEQSVAWKHNAKKKISLFNRKYASKAKPEKFFRSFQLILEAISGLPTLPRIKSARSMKRAALFGNVDTAQPPRDSPWKVETLFGGVSLDGSCVTLDTTTMVARVLKPYLREHYKHDRWTSQEAKSVYAALREVFGNGSPEAPRGDIVYFRRHFRPQSSAQYCGLWSCLFSRVPKCIRTPPEVERGLLSDKRRHPDLFFGTIVTDGYGISVILQSCAGKAPNAVYILGTVSRCRRLHFSSLFSHIAMDRRGSHTHQTRT